VTAETDTPRPLSERERNVLDFMLSVEAPGVAELREQARTATATGWDCGCASIDLHVDRGSTQPSSIRSRPAIETETKERSDPNGTFDLLVWVDAEGWLSGLEIVDYLDRHVRLAGRTARTGVLPATQNAVATRDGWCMSTARG
jgi:hypothetical protein